MSGQQRKQYPITLMPMGKTVEIDTGQTLLDGLREHVNIRADCGGKGFCGKCRVVIEVSDVPEPTEIEKQLIPENLIETGCRLACQVSVNNPMMIHIPEQSQDKGQVQGKTIHPGPYPVSSSERQMFSGPHKTEIGNLGLAVDIGTTTIAVYLCDLIRGTIVGSAAAVNPQRRFGEDVVNRIQAASDKEGLAHLSDLVRDAIGYLAKECLFQKVPAKSGKTLLDIEEVMVVGNTAMQHIFSGIDPSRLARTPFEPESYDAMQFSAKEFGFEFSDGCTIYVMPVISGFAGGDILSCALADGILDREETTLIVDVGTNGELILGNCNGLWATSCATGPAFEGAQISCGMRATLGAISACTYNGASDRFVVETIGGISNHPPLGICGSGVIDAVLALREARMVNDSGQLIDRTSGKGLSRVTIVNGYNGTSNAQDISNSSDMSNRSNMSDAIVYLTQQDVRQIQLAKAALATGIISLLEKSGVVKVDRTILTGAFGTAFNWKRAVGIGMLPDPSLLGDIMGQSNLAGQGAVMALLDSRQRAAAEEIGRRTNYLHLANEAEFIRRFVAQTRFP